MTWRVWPCMLETRDNTIQVNVRGALSSLITLIEYKLWYIGYVYGSSFNIRAYFVFVLFYYLILQNELIKQRWTDNRKYFDFDLCYLPSKQYMVNYINYGKTRTREGYVQAKIINFWKLLIKLWKHKGFISAAQYRQKCKHLFKKTK